MRIAYVCADPGVPAASTTTSNPAAVSFLTTSGTSATRRSPGAVSFGTAILTALEL